MKKIFLFLIVTLACTIGMTSCGEDDIEPGNVPLTEITTDRDDGISLNVRYGEASDNIKLYPVPPNATDVNFKLTSADPTVATVEETALGESRITVLKPGSTTVTIASGSVTKEIAVTGRWDVTALEEIRLDFGNKNPASGSDTTLIFNLAVHDSIQVTASANPRNANTDTTDYVTFIWKSSKSSVATTVTEDEGTKTEIDKKGVIKAVSTGVDTVVISCGEIKTKDIIIHVGGS